MITENQLRLILPRLAKNTKRFSLYLPLLDAAMIEAQINTKARIAAFLSQVAHESDEFKYMSEIWGPTAQQMRYDPPTTLAKRLGNHTPGDGYRYRGAGPIQITGRDNFRKAGMALGLDLEGHPELAFTPGVGFRTAAWFWNSRGLNALADALTLNPTVDTKAFDRITLRINGGYNGKAHRDAYYARACQVLGI